MVPICHIAVVWCFHAVSCAPCVLQLLQIVIVVRITQLKHEAISY